MPREFHAEFTAEGNHSAAAAASEPQCWRRADLHCHSVASTEADEAVLNALQCPECYSEPADVYALAKRRGMDFVTITDHDCIDGVLSLGARRDVIVGEELTCYFPEDRCKMHVLVWGIGREDHDVLQARAGDIYRVAEYIEHHNIAHAVAHPLYRQNDLLGRWHIERLVLMFKGFECLNGAHSMLHREAFEPVLDELSEERIAELADRHGMRPRWPTPWIKARTAGSDDHGLLNIGRTWTEFPPDVRTPAEALTAIREARCRPGGEAGSSLKLAHNFFSVGIRYYTRNIASAARKGGGLAVQLLQTLVGDRRRLRKRDLLKHALGRSVAVAKRTLAWPFRRSRSPASGTALLGRVAWQSIRKPSPERAAVLDALRRGVAPLGEHEDIFRLVCGLDRDITTGIFDAVRAGMARGELATLFDALSAVAAQQFALLPYYFALFHQNKERNLCGGVTGHGKPLNAETLKIGLFTDTYDEVNGVSRFLRRIGDEADRRGRQLTIATCHPSPNSNGILRQNFQPLVSIPLPQYPQIKLSLPPVLEILEWADRQQFDAIHVSTPGPMGLVGLLVAKMLRVPVVGTYHTDFPAYVRELTGDFRLTAAATQYMRWFYGGVATVFARSRAYESALHELGVAPAAARVLPPCTDAEAFHPRHRDTGLYTRMGVREPLRLLYVGRISKEKNLALLADSFKRLCEHRRDVALIVVGDGPFLPELKQRLSGVAAYFTGNQQGERLAALYASADLFVFPSRTDTLGQVVIEAQASGLPVLVADAGGPQEVMDEAVTGRVVAGVDPTAWADAIDDLLDDLPCRSRMSRSAAQRARRFTRAATFDQFWEQHVRVAKGAAVTDLWGEPQQPERQSERRHSSIPEKDECPLSSNISSHASESSETEVAAS